MSQPIQYRLLTAEEKKNVGPSYQRPPPQIVGPYSGPFSSLVKNVAANPRAEKEQRDRAYIMSAFAKKQGGKKRRTSKSTRKSRGRKLSRTRKYRR